MGIMSWIVFGLIVGAFVRLLRPGEKPIRWLMTFGIGVVGAVAGGFMGNFMGFGDLNLNRFDLRTLLVAIAGSMVLLYVCRLYKRQA
jgi:uncharacterized membrane protein YeaQ/YmgE (transglycosylase-associated protein family)